MWRQLPSKERSWRWIHVRPLLRPEARHGVTFSLRITRGRCPGLRHRQITGATLRPSRVFLLHVGTQDGGGSGGGGA